MVGNIFSDTLVKERDTVSTLKLVHALVINRQFPGYQQVIKYVIT